MYFQHSMIYFFHHYELPVILQQAQIRDRLNRSNGQVHINFNNVVSMNNNNNNNNAAKANNNNMAANNNNNNTANNVVRRIIRPRFTLGRFQFRFVFQALHNPTPPPAPPQQPQPPTVQATTDAENSASNSAGGDNQSNHSTLNNTTGDATILNNSTGNVASSLPPAATTEDSVDTAAIQQYAAQVVESAREMEQMDGLTDRLNNATVSGTGTLAPLEG
jgi:hypothetical protein